MKLTKPMVAVATMLAGALLSQECMALQAGDNAVYLGGASVSSSASLGTLSSSGPAATTFNALTPGTTASIPDASTVVVSYLHMFTDNVAGEVTVGNPLAMKVNMTIPNIPLSVSNAATTDAAFPSVVFKYLFNAPSSAFRPYVGLGVNYTYFSNISVSTNSTVRSLAGTSQSLSSSWNPVFSAGAIYELNDHWSLNFGVSYVPLSTDVTFVGTGTTTTGKLTINPTDVVFKVGYKF